MKIERLPDAQLDIMKELWKSEKPLKASEIAKNLSEKHAWKVPTVHVLLSRLLEKGLVLADRSSYSHRFSAAISEKDYMQSQSSTLLEKSGTRIHTMFAALIDSADITDEELCELSRLLDEKMKEIREKKEK